MPAKPRVESLAEMTAPQGIRTGAAEVVKRERAGCMECTATDWKSVWRYSRQEWETRTC